MTIILCSEELPQSFSEEDPGWILVTSEGQVPRRKKIFKSNVKMRFNCDCSNHWTTARGICKVSLWTSSRQWCCFFLVYNQKCNQCEKWCEMDKIYDLEFQHILTRMNDIRFNRGKTKTARAKSKMKRSHDKHRCEACQNGECSKSERTIENNE